MKLVKVHDASEGHVAAAGVFMAITKDRPHSPVGLATGETMVGLYAQLSQRHFRPKFQDIFLLDEYVGLPQDSPNSFEHEIRVRFCEPLNFTGQVHVPGQGPYAGDQGLELFEEVLSQKGPLSVQLLGLGTNGHIAFNEPGSSHDSRTRMVTLSEETRAANSSHFPVSEKMPTHAVSQGIATIREASSLLLLVFGKKKETALRAAIAEDSPIHPLRGVLRHPKLTLITDIDI